MNKFLRLNGFIVVIFFYLCVSFFQGFDFADWQDWAKQSFKFLLSYAVIFYSFKREWINEAP